MAKEQKNDFTPWCESMGGGGDGGGVCVCVCVCVWGGGGLQVYIFQIYLQTIQQNYTEYYSLTYLANIC